MALKLSIVSPEKVLYEGDVTSIIVPGSKGQFEILQNHAPIISSLEEGTIIYNDGTKKVLNIKSGFVEVVKNNVSLCVEGT